MAMKQSTIAARREQAAADRETIAEQRRTFYEGRKKGMSHEVASAVANGWIGEADAGRMEMKADAGEKAETKTAPDKEPDKDNEIDRDAVEIVTDEAHPDFWGNLHWAKLSKLAASVSDEPIKNKKDAIAAIEAELERRQAEAEPEE